MRNLDKSLETERTKRIKKGAHTSYVSLTKKGNMFDGVIQFADVATTASGYIFGSSEFKDGEYIETSEVIKINSILAVGDWIETKNGSRYLISDIDENWCLDITQSNWYQRKEKQLKVILRDILIGSNMKTLTASTLEQKNKDELTQFAEEQRKKINKHKQTKDDKCKGTAEPKV